MVSPVAVGYLHTLTGSPCLWWRNVGAGAEAGAIMGCQSPLVAGAGVAIASLPAISRAASAWETERIAASNEIGSLPPSPDAKSFQTPLVRLIDRDDPAAPDRFPACHSLPDFVPAGSHSRTRVSRHAMAAWLICWKSGFIGCRRLGFPMRAQPRLELGHFQRL